MGQSGWWVADTLAHSPVLLVSWVLWVIGSIVLHELSHGWAAIRVGDRTPIETGHMTWNPTVHMGGMSLIVFLVIGIAWGAMPVSPGRMRGRHADAYVSAAGPAMNLLLAIAAMIGAGLVSVSSLPDPLGPNLLTFFSIGATLNVVLMLFNLLPIPPLDGSSILTSFVPSFRYFYQTQQGQVVGLLVFVGVFFFGGKLLFGLAGDVATTGIGLVSRVLGAGP